MKMLRSKRNAWVAALRSGEYQQARNALAKITGGHVSYCCLGVACEIARPHLPGLTVRERFETPNGCLRLYDESPNYPPPLVAEWLGATGLGGDWIVRVPDLAWPGASRFVPLASRNDSGASFAEIADLIENDLDAVDDVRDDLEEARS